MADVSNAQSAQPTEATPKTGRRKVAIDMDAHNGLRGVSAIWIMWFHALLFCVTPSEWQGSSLMPLFFILSGFSLMVVYGGKPEVYAHESTSTATSSTAPATSVAGDTGIRWWPYFQNRIARVMPMYYAANALALPYWFFGYGSIPQNNALGLALSIVFTAFPLATLLAPGAGLYWVPLDSPSWTVQTLLWMWAFFPYFLKGVRKLSDADLVNRIVLCYWAQLILACGIFFPYFLSTFVYFPAFATATMQPFSRMPVFLMGMYAGALCLRHPDPEEPMPFPSPLSMLVFCTGRCCKGSQQGKAAWAKEADWYCIGLFITTLLIGALETLFLLLTGGGSLQSPTWNQALVAGAQLYITVALTREGGLSMAGKVLKGSIPQWLGQYSMAIYLVHIPVIYYLAWAVAGRINTAPSTPFASCPDAIANPAANKACTDAWATWGRTQLVPSWGIVPVTFVSLGLAYLAYHLIEEPGRKAWRYKGSETGGAAVKVPVVAPAPA